MLLGMSWWASLYVLAILFMLTEMLSGLTGDESDGEESFGDYVSFFGQLLNGIALIALSVLFFQNLEAAAVKWSFVAIAGYVLLFCSISCVQELWAYIKNPTGKSAESEESGELITTVLGYSIVWAYYGVGLAITVVGLQRALAIF